MALSIASLHIYPIKSLGGIGVTEARVTDRGFEHDRRWMLVDHDGTFITQREVPAMACLHTAAADEGFAVTDLRNGDVLHLPWALDEGADAMVEVWSARVRAREASRDRSAWFSAHLGRPVRLVHMPDTSHRRVDGRYAEGLTSFSDGFPWLIISQASLDDLNARLAEPVGMERFRPNIVVAGGAAIQEDDWREVMVGDVRFTLVKPCARCTITTTDQRTGERSKEPLRTLAGYRTRQGKVMFGVNAVGAVTGRVRVGDPVTVVS
jgi:uncharacterized protein YcbX